MSDQRSYTREDLNIRPLRLAPAELLERAAARYIVSITPLERYCCESYRRYPVLNSQLIRTEEVGVTAPPEVVWHLRCRNCDKPLYSFSEPALRIAAEQEIENNELIAAISRSGDRPSDLMILQRVSQALNYGIPFDLGGQLVAVRSMELRSISGDAELALILIAAPRRPPPSPWSPPPPPPPSPPQRRLKPTEKRLSRFMSLDDIEINEASELEDTGSGDEE